MSTNMRMNAMRCLLLLLSFIIAAVPAAAQQSQVVITEEDYARAESLLKANTMPLVSGAISSTVWLSDTQFLYQNSIPEGTEYILADADAKTRKRAFDHQRLARALSALTGTNYDPYDLPLSQIELSTDMQTMSFFIRDSRYSCDLRTYKCTTAADIRMARSHNAVISPDGRYSAFIRDYNLWVFDFETGREIQLTTDGVKDFGYATNNAGWAMSDMPVLMWAPTSDMIATFQHDSRGAGEMYLATTNVGHPKLEAWKYPLPGDDIIFRMHRVVLHIDGQRVVRLQMPPDPHRSTTSDHVAGRGGLWLDVEWSEDAETLAFVSSSRDHKEAKLRTADPNTGVVRDILEEKTETYYESGSRIANWHVLTKSNEAIWFSERDNWGHLYLYDLGTGRLKHQITKGDWCVLQLLHIDQENRTLYFTGSGRESGDPYFKYLYSINMDGTGLKCLTPEKGDHTILFSPSYKSFYDTYSTPVKPPVAMLRDLQGRKIMDLEKADISRLLAHGWQPPVPFTVKARDGRTDLYGLMYKPTNFDASKKYPVLNYLYPGPQSGSIGSRSFQTARSDKQSLAELGFIVVEVDAMGTPGRSKSFHDAYYGNMGDNGLPDQIAMIKQLAGKYDWMDIDRVGIWGHSGGGFASTDAILRYPDFYKVAVSGAGNHDNRNYEDDWAEKWQGLLETYPDGTTNYDNQANQLLAKNLKGKLLLAHGTMDPNVPYYTTLLVVNELIAANKNFDLLLLPNRTHGFSNEQYMMRRRWDYFVRHLHGIEPPKEYKFTSDTSLR